MRPKLSTLFLNWAAVTLGAFISISAQVVDEAFPIAPENGASVGPRAIFQIGLDGDEIEDVRFRLVFSQDEFETESYVFDQMESMSGWALNILANEYGMVFRPPRPLDEGVYQWRVDAHDGVDWVEGEDIWEVDIDATNPAPVERMKVDLNGDGETRLRWLPVAFDEDGDPEYVKRYRVYRSTRKGLFLMIRAFQAGEVDTTEFVDEEDLEDAPLVFYRVMAEDEAGNHRTGSWEPTFPPLPEEEAAANEATMKRQEEFWKQMMERKKQKQAEREEMLKNLKKQTDNDN